MPDALQVLRCPKIRLFGNASVAELAYQIRTIIDSEKVRDTERFNVHFARMGEPTFNNNVLAFSLILKDLVKSCGLKAKTVHPVVSTMLPKSNKGLEKFIQKWCFIKNEYYDGEAGLQFSINSTDDNQRNELFAGKSLSLTEISDLARRLPAPKGRKYTLNFPVTNQTILDAKKLSELFDKDKFIVKITPIHETNSAIENGFEVSGYADYDVYRKFEQPKFIDMQYGNGTPVSVEKPANTITTNPKMNLVTAKSWIMDTSFKNVGSSLDEPSRVITANRKWHYLMNPQYTSAGGSVDKPCFTLIARMDKMPPYLVATETGEAAIEVYETDSPTTVKIKEFMALYGIIDIKMRMLKIPELKKIMGFPEDYVLVGTQAEQKKYIGNAVEVTVARRWCESLCAELDKNHKRVINGRKDILPKGNSYAQGAKGVFYQSRSQTALRNAKALEAEIDREIERTNNILDSGQPKQANLFND